MQDPRSRKSKLQHYFMVTAQIVFRTAEEGSPPNQLMVNCVTMTKDGRIPLFAMGRAQQTAQMAFHQKMQDPTLIVIDVVLYNFTYLGVFTEEDFNKMPKLTETPPMEQLPMGEVIPSGNG